MTTTEWQKLVESGQIKDLSAELSDSFLMYGQLMLAKIEWKGKVFLATAWAPAGPAYVELLEQI